MKKNVPIYIILTGVMLFWGLNVAVIKILVDYFPPVTITALRILTAGITVFIILGFLHKIRKPTAAEFGYIIVGGLLNVVAHHYFLATGLAKTTATNGGLILGMGPLLTACFAMVFLKRFPSFVQFIGFLLGAAGISLTVLAGSKDFSGINVGDLYIFFAIVTQALSFIVIKKASKTLDPRLLTGYMLVIGATGLFIIGLWTEPSGLARLGSAPAFVWAAFLGSAILATGLGHMVYNYAIGQTGPAEAAIFINLSTFFSLLGSFLFLGETLMPSHFLGLFLIISGVVLGSGAFEELVVKRKRKHQMT